ncbi:MAG: 4'-phosphopantetheinyl transferase superfamily protein [Gammaproteobacteria bacterium]|nr:4'-phosphopantetheinyl transferase superfamily protein [Gammaproteobacteria bacterium]
MSLRLLLAPIPDHEPLIALAEADQARLAAMALARRRQFLAGRQLLVEAGISELVVDEQGKPHGSAGQPISLSHSRQFVAAVVGEASGLQLGLDVEQPRPRRALDALLARTLQVEANRWQQADDELRARLFYAGWTLREALAKADGRGLAWSLGAVAMSGDWLDSGALALTVRAPQPGAGAVWQLGDDLYMALAVVGDGPLPPCHWQQPPPWPPQLLWQGQWRGQL